MVGKQRCRHIKKIIGESTRMAEIVGAKIKSECNPLAGFVFFYVLLFRQTAVVEDQGIEVAHVQH